MPYGNIPSKHINVQSKDINVQSKDITYLDTLYRLTEDCRKSWNFKYQNLVFSFLTFVIILLFPPIYMLIEHSFMNYSYTTKIYIYIYIYIYIIALPYLINVLSTLMPDISTLIKRKYIYIYIHDMMFFCIIFIKNSAQYKER